MGAHTHTHTHTGRDVGLQLLFHLGSRSSEALRWMGGTVCGAYGHLHPGWLMVCWSSVTHLVALGVY